jgi:large repetitive protein
MRLLLLLPLALVGACDKVPLLAPTGTVINLFPATTSVSLNSEVTIIATVIENGVASGGTTPGGGNTTRTGNGTPVQNGTVISFTTTIGRIEPADARTSNGQVNVRLITGGTSGTATITAYSGGASSQVQLKVGAAAASTLSVTASPANLGSTGGSALITATVLDEGGSGIGGVPITFATDKGTITPTTANTDAFGNAAATLTTSSTAKVTVTAAGGKNNSVTVNVNARILAFFNAVPNTTAKVAIPVRFDVGAGSGANLSNVRVEFGDGDSTDLGAVNGGTTTSAVHAFCSPGQFTATATAVDVTGERQQLNTSVIVGALPVTLTPSNPSPTVGTPVSFTVTGTDLAQVSHYTWTWDDGTPSFNTSAPSTTHTFTTRGLKTIRVDVAGVGCGNAGGATVVLNVS